VADEGTSHLTAVATVTIPITANLAAGAELTTPGLGPVALDAGATVSAELTYASGVRVTAAIPAGAITTTSPTATPATTTPATPSSSGAFDGAWHNFSFQIPGKDLTEKARSALETLMTYLEVVKAVLETVKTFLVDFGNPIKALVDALVKLILQLFELLKRTGVYAFNDYPNPFSDPNFKKSYGGYKAFTTRFKSSLYDERDQNRPQPVAGATKSGFVMIVVDASTSLQLLRLARQLLRFFGKDLTAPHYQAPSNVKVLPVGAKGDPILSVVKAFGTQPEAIAIEWSLPTNQQSPDPGFSDLVTSVGTEFIPPKFLIERSDFPVTPEIDMSEVDNPHAVGVVTTTYETDFELRGKPGQRMKRKERVTDEYGDPFVKFQKYTVIDATHATGTFLLGQLGKFRYIDNEVEFGQTYYYRVRAFSGDLAVASDKSIDFKIPERKDPITNTWVLSWPALGTSDPPVMGRASGTARVRLVKLPSNFDVVGNLTNIFQAAFSLNFHQPVASDAKFDSAGVPVAPTLNSEVGKGSLVRQGGVLSQLVNIPLIGPLAAGVADPGGFKNDYVIDEATGKYPEMPWQNKQVRRLSARLATTVASALLQAGSGTIEQFRTLMQTPPLPKGAPADAPTLPAGTNTLEKLIAAIVKVDADGNTDRNTVVLYSDIFADVATRQNILQAVNLIQTFTLKGTPPDWIQVSILRDIIPWSGQFLYDLSAKINALLDAYRGTMDEIKDFINLIERKIDTLERFLQYLISLLDFITSLSVGAYFLSLPETGGDIQDWIQAIDTAGGTPPTSGPNGYTAGTVFAYLGPDVGPYVTAFNAIF
jgi:hypothetical protein